MLQNYMRALEIVHFISAMIVPKSSVIDGYNLWHKQLSSPLVRDFLGSSHKSVWQDFLIAPYTNYAHILWLKLYSCLGFTPV